VWRTRDPDGREVVLTWAGWSHIIRRHPYIGVTPDDIVAIVESPDEHRSKREEAEEWYYGRAIGPSRWIRVVVHYECGRGLIVTAFPRRSLP
jgi:hypothetical protein